MSKTVDDATPLEGASVNYSLTVTNNSGQDATGVVVTDNLPAGVTYVSDSGGYNDATGQWNVGTVSAGSSAALQITVNINAGTTGSTIENVAAITSADQPDPDSGNNAAAASLTVMPELSIGDVSLPEGDSGTTAFVFNLTLSAGSSQAVSVTYDTADGTATVADNDYQPVSGGVVNFPIGSTSQPLTIDVVGDSRIESDETFFVNLSGPVNTLMADNQGLGTIVNDDSVLCSSPTLTLTAQADTWIRENNTGYSDTSPILQVKPDTSIAFRSLIHFDISGNITPTVTIDCAYLLLYETTTITTGQTVYVHPLTESWIDSESNWFDRTSAQTWTTPGGTYDSAVTSFSPDTLGVRSIDLTWLVQQWVDNPGSDLGILLRSTTTGDNAAVEFASLEDGVNPPPRLIIQY